MKESILVTGGAGFIGANFLNHFCLKYSDYNIINLDLLTYANSLENLKAVESLENYTFIKGDICDRELVESIFSSHKVTGVIHFAAGFHVDNSISGPGKFIRTNINGTFTHHRCC